MSTPLTLTRAPSVATPATVTLPEIGAPAAGSWMCAAGAALSKSMRSVVVGERWAESPGTSNQKPYVPSPSWPEVNLTFAVRASMVRGSPRSGSRCSLNADADGALGQPTVSCGKRFW